MVYHSLSKPLKPRPLRASAPPTFCCVSKPLEALLLLVEGLNPWNEALPGKLNTVAVCGGGDKLYNETQSIYSNVISKFKAVKKYSLGIVGNYVFNFMQFYYSEVKGGDQIN